jgi:hypothetical protein
LNSSNLYVADRANDRIQVFGALLTSTSDFDRDGIEDFLDLDVDNDGILNSDEMFAAGSAASIALAREEEDANDPDGDGIPNEFDLDSDGDGIPDAVEAGGEDENGDGLIDGFEDADQDGYADKLMDAPLPVPDTDEDGIPDFLDGDSDNDGVSDVREAGGVDDDGDGQLDDSLDEDGDGLADIVQTSAGGEPLPLEDRDGDGVADFQDSDQGTGGGSCSIAPAGSAKSFPIYLLLPLLIVLRKIWRRSNSDTRGRV